MKAIGKDGHLAIRKAKPGVEPLQVLFAGDLAPMGRPEELALQGKVSNFFAPLANELSRKDLSIVNLEAPLTEAESPIAKSGPNLKAHPKTAAFLNAGSFDVACCANNHLGDHGGAVAAETLRHVADAGLAIVGAGLDPDVARGPLVVERKGVRLAILAFAENEFGTVAPGKPGVNPLNPLRNIQDIRAAAKTADLVLVLIHGGNEYCPVPSPRMRQTYRAFAEAGAAAVVAGHTHCAQGMELWKGVPIAYSLGNFLFDHGSSMDRDHPWWRGFLLRISFVGKKAAALDVIPYSFEKNPETVTPMQGDERTSAFAYLNHLNKLVEHEAEADRLWDAWCAMQGPWQVGSLSQCPCPPEWSNPDSVGKFMALRNHFTCEAHNELKTNYLRMIEEKRLDAAARGIDDIKTLQRWEIPAATGAPKT